MSFTTTTAVKNALRIPAGVTQHDAAISAFVDHANATVLAEIGLAGVTEQSYTDVLDVDDWSICYAVLRYEPAGENQKLLGVALDALTLDSENECLVVAADDEALRRARGFDRNAPPPAPDPLFTAPAS